MASRGYAINSNKPAFSTLDDDEAAFMSSSSAAYLAADRLPQSPAQRAAEEAETQRQEVLKQMRDVERRTTESSKRSIAALAESEQVGIDTATELVRQREQLENTDRRLDDINSSLKDSQKNINGIKSVFSSLKTWWSSPKQDAKDKNASNPTSPADESKPPPSAFSNKNLGSAVNKSQAAVESTRGNHPALRLRGLEEEEDEPSLDDWRANTQRVNKQLDNDLDEMSAGLARLKGLAIGLGDEVTDQNSMLDRIQVKADNADQKIEGQNLQIKKLLKR